jgi:hypothetical protein
MLIGVERAEIRSYSVTHRYREAVVNSKSVPIS